MIILFMRVSPLTQTATTSTVIMDILSDDLAKNARMRVYKDQKSGQDEDGTTSKIYADNGCWPSTHICEDLIIISLLH